MDSKKLTTLTALDLLKAQQTHFGVNDRLSSVIAATIARPNPLTELSTSWFKAMSLNAKTLSLFDISNNIALRGLDRPDWARMIATGINTAAINAKQIFERPHWFDQQKKMASLFAISNNAATIIARQSMNDAFTAKISDVLSTSNNIFFKQKSIADTFAMVISNNKQIYTSVDTFKNYYTNPDIRVAINGWQAALSGIGKQISSDVVKHKDVAMLNEFEKVTAKVVSITDSLVAQKSITPDVNAMLNEKLEALKSDFFSKIDLTAQKGAIKTDLGLYIGIISIILSILFYYSPLDTTQKQTLSKEQSITLKKELLGAVYEKLELDITYAVVKKNCPLFFKPSWQSLRLMTLYSPLSVTILGQKGEWIQVTFLNIEGDPVIGWVQQKYILALLAKRNKITKGRLTEILRHAEEK